MQRAVKIGLIASFLLLLTVNVVMLDLVVIFGRKSEPSQVSVATVRVTPAPWESAIEDLNRRIDALVATASSPATVVQQLPSVQTAKEYYILLGSGTAKNSTWQDIAGAEALIDTSKYPSIKSVTFEAFLNIPTANGEVRAKLYNVTDKHDVWFSEVSSEGPTVTKKEATITLDQGAKTYRVMGLSTLKYDANIQNARIRIVTY